MHVSIPAKFLVLGYTLFFSAVALPVLESATITTLGSSHSLKLRRGKSSATAPLVYRSNRGRWYTDFTIGGQELTLEVDTGSADL